MRASAREGFTLVELMIVVAIMGILSAVAVLSFRRYVYNVRTGEAYWMLGTIKALQETYRREQEVDSYCLAPGHPNAGIPAAGQPQPWNVGVPDAWRQIGVRPDSSDVWFVYEVFRGAAGTAPETPQGAYPWDGVPDEPWFIAQARADLDGDGIPSLIELCSRCRLIFVAQPNQVPGFDFEGQ